VGADPTPRRLRADESIPAELVGALADRLYARTDELDRQGASEPVARAVATRAATAAFRTAAAARGVAVDDQRLAQLAGDLLDLDGEYRGYGHAPEQARARAVLEALEAERVRAETDPREPTAPGQTALTAGRDWARPGPAQQRTGPTARGGWER
jgi:hypothetical protein